MLICRTTLKGLAALTLVCALTPAFAGNVTFMKNSAISKMTEQDLEIMRAAARNALDYIADGQPRRWQNNESGAAGVLTPLDTFEHEGTSCRRLEMFNEVQGITGRSVFVFCRQPDGTWKVPATAPSDPATAK